MKARRGLALLIVGLMFGPALARAAEPPLAGKWFTWFGRPLDLWKGCTCWCPDDYCPKTLPCVSCTPKGCVDDYCPKTLPCVPPCAGGCVDDYCPKNCP